MKKLKSSFKNMVIVLTTVTVISGVLLGYMNGITKEPIAKANAKALSDAIAQVVPGFTDQSTITVDTVEQRGVKYVINKVTTDGKLMGAAVESSGKGFNGVIKIIVGFDAEGKIYDYSVLNHAETPGLGSKMDVWFKTDKNNQSIIGLNPGQNPMKVSKDGGQIDAITASTITSRAFLTAINEAYKVYEGGGNASDGTSGATSATDATSSDTTTTDGSSGATSH